MENPEEIQAADPLARRQLMVRVAPMAGLGLVLAAGLTAWTSWSPRDGSLAPLIGAFAVLCAISLLMLGFLLRLRRLARATSEQRRFPPSGVAVIRDTRVRHGERAEALGKRLQDLAELMMFFVVLVPISIAWLVWRFAS